jgi:hypothetical protein
VKEPYSTVYACDKCKQSGVKLWRGIHGCADANGYKLLCASCLAPGKQVDDNGKVMDAQLGFQTDQVMGWLPAVPVDDTYWGYTSVPDNDVAWWLALPTYPSVTP